MRTLTLALCLLLSACATVPNIPEQITVVVEKFKPLPAWATDELPKPVAADGTVGARVRSEDARGHVIDLANCHRRLLRRLDAGQAVDRRECARRD